MPDNRLGEMPWLIDVVTGRPNGVRTPLGETFPIAWANGDAVDFRRYDPPTNGSTDATAKWVEACAEAQALGVPVMLPPWPIVVARTVAINKIIGTPGKSKIILAPSFTLTRYGQYAFENQNFGTSYNASTADDVFYQGFDVELSPNAPMAVFGMGNIKSGVFDQLRLTARQVIGGNSKPVVVNSLIDLYSAVKNTVVQRCEINQLTGGYATTPVATDGGGGIWVRNFSSNGSIDANATEDIWIINSIFRNTTTDEALAVYGTRGTTRRVHVLGNKFYGLPAIAPGYAYHNTLVSVFPQDDGSGVNLGNTAAVYDIDVFDNIFYDQSFLYSVLRFGSATDAARPCYNIKSARNKITAFRSSNGTTGPKAVWVAAGSVGTDPDIGSIVLRAIAGTQGTGFPSNFPNFTSNGDTVYNLTGGSQTNTAISSFDVVTDANVQGDLYTGVANCVNVTGGSVQAFGRAFYNCNNVQAARFRVTGGGPSYAACQIDASGADRFTFAGCTGQSGGSLVKIESAVPAGSRISILGNNASIGSGGTSYGVNNASTSAYVVARLNDVQGTVTGPVTGTAITRTLNNWAGTTD